MAWDFSTDAEFEEQLRWIDDLVREEIEPLDVLFPENLGPWDRSNPKYQPLVDPIIAKVKAQGLWASHMPHTLGGREFGQVKLALMNEILGRSRWAPTIFGTMAPDSGNAELLAKYANEEQKAKYLEPLLDGKIASSFSMTEPQGGSDPGVFTCRAERDGDGWVINGEKWMAGNFQIAAFVIVMVITNADVPVHHGASMMLVPKDTPGLEMIRVIGNLDDALGEGNHCYIRFTDCRLPFESLIGTEGEAFKMAQSRLAGGRIHHAMRMLGQMKASLDMMLERSVSRHTRGGLLSDLQITRHTLADVWIAMEQYRLQLLHAAWVIDDQGYDAARMYIAAIKAAMPKFTTEIVLKAMHLHGSLGMSNEMPMARWWAVAPALGVADGPTEVHKDTVAKALLKNAKPVDTLFPSQHIPTRLEAARKKYAAQLAESERLVAAASGGTI